MARGVFLRELYFWRTCLSKHVQTDTSILIDRFVNSKNSYISSGVFAKYEQNI